mgnify:CR=1 FL=1
MKVAVLFSGGKDSTYVIKYCRENGIDIKALIAVKPVNEEAYLWHYSTVEWTKLQAEAMNLPLIFLNCNEIGPEVEAKCLEHVLKNLDVDALFLGGVGLQKTQIREVRNVARKFDIDVIVPYEHYTSEELLKEEIESGLEIVITEVAASGLTKDWLGRKIDESSFEELKVLSEKFGFDPLGEGGSYNTFVTYAPYFSGKITFSNQKIVWDEKTRSGHIVTDAVLVPKNEEITLSVS